MARGGRRNGVAGKAYPQRTDLNSQAPIARIPGQPYGEQAKQVESQRQIPMASGPSVSPSMTPGLRGVPSERPSEPLTAGLPSGAGPGPEAVEDYAPRQPKPGVAELETIYRLFPYPGIRRLLNTARRQP